jgi:hypothetical protein
VNTIPFIGLGDVKQMNPPNKDLIIAGVVVAVGIACFSFYSVFAGQRATNVTPEQRAKARGMTDSVSQESKRLQEEARSQNPTPTVKGESVQPGSQPPMRP